MGVDASKNQVMEEEGRCCAFSPEEQRRGLVELRHLEKVRKLHDFPQLVRLVLSFGHVPADEVSVARRLEK